MAEEGYLPPVVIAVVGDARNWAGTVAEVKASLADLAKADVQPKVGGDAKSFQATYSDVVAQLANLSRRVTNTKLGANPDLYWAEIARVLAETEALHPSIGVEADLKWNTLLGDLAAAKTAMDLAQTKSLLGAGLAGAAAKGAGDAAKGAGDALVTKALLADAIGFGGGGGGFFSRLMSPLTLLSTLFSAKFMSLGALAGFGPEHLALTGVGMLGSMAGGGIGAGLLGLGALGTEGVGLGTDMAGIGQAVGDIKNVTQAQANLSSAIATYGGLSQEAATAQAQLNQALGSFSPVARQSVLATSNIVDGWRAAFDRATGLAEMYGAQIVGQAVLIGEKFLPVIGKYAAENTRIIQTDLQPLFTWLQGPGMGILVELENKFQKDLPTAMAAFDNGVELVIRMIGYIAPQTGHFVQSLDDLFTRLNGSGWTKFTGEMQDMINLFHTWHAFFKILFDDVADIFAKTAGLGAGIAELLTGYLDRLHTVLTTAGDSDNLSKVFKLHKSEILELIGVLVDFGKILTQVYLNAAPFLITLATDLVKVINAVLQFVHFIPYGDDVLGLLLIISRVKMLGFVFTAMGGIATRVFGAILARSGAAIFGAEKFASMLGVSPAGSTSGLAVGGEAAEDVGPSVAVDAEDVGALTSKMATLGPSVAVAAVAIGALVGGLELWNHTGTVTPAVVQKLTDGVQNLNASNSLPSLSTNLSAVTSQLHTLEATPQSTFSSIFPDASRWAAAMDLVNAKLADTAALANYKSNVSVLGKQMGLTDSQIVTLANDLGIKLYTALDQGGAFKKMNDYLNSLANQAGTTQGALRQMATNMGVSWQQVATNVVNAMSSTKGAFNAFSTELSTGSTAKETEDFYTTQASQATAFADNVQKALTDGYKPQAILALLEQGQAQAGTTLKGLVSKQASAMSQIITNAQHTTAVQGNLWVTEAGIIEKAIQLKSGQMAQALPIAIQLAIASTKANATEQVDSIVKYYNLTWPQVEQLAHTYAGALPQSLLAQVGATFAASNKVTAAVTTPLNSLTYKMGWGLGINVVLGLQAGMKSQEGPAATAAANVGYALEGALRNSVEAKSPSQVFHRAGVDVMAGLAQGITEGTNLPVLAMIAAANKLKKVPLNFNTFGAGVIGAPGATGGGGVTLNVTANFTINAPGGNPSAIKGAMQDSAEQFTASVSKSLGSGAGSVYG